MASNVTPSIPGAPLLLLAIWWASWSVFILQTWTYSPQKRQVGSAFALTYILLLRSCKLMGVFIIHRCLPSCWSSYTTAGPLRSTGITPLHCYCWPLRHPLAVHRFPGVPGYTVFCSVVFLHGTRRASPVA